MFVFKFLRTSGAWSILEIEIALFRSLVAISARSPVRLASLHITRTIWMAPVNIPLGSNANSLQCRICCSLWVVACANQRAARFPVNATKLGNSCGIFPFDYARICTIRLDSREKCIPALALLAPTSALRVCLLHWTHIYLHTLCTHYDDRRQISLTNGRRIV